MIEELKRQLAEIDKDLKPTLAHVAAVQARRAQLAERLLALEAVDKAVPPKPKAIEPESVKVDPKPSKGK